MISDAYAEAVASFVVDNGLGVVFSQKIGNGDQEAGKKARSGWPSASNLLTKDQAFLLDQLKKNYGTRNLLVITGQSKVVTIDCDTQAGLALYQSWNPPKTVTISTGRDGGGFHFVFRPPDPDRRLTFFELAGEEEGRVTGASTTKLHVLCGLHKTGRPYKLVRDNGLKIAEMPVDLYERFEEGYGLNHRSIRTGIHSGKLVEPSGRHQYLLDRASEYELLGHRGDVLAAHLRVDWELGCMPDPGRDIEKEIKDIVTHTEKSW